MKKQITILLAGVIILSSSSCGKKDTQTLTAPDKKIADSAFIRDDTAYTQFTSWVDDIDLPPVFLRETFGDPIRDNGFRVTGRYVFVSPDNDVFTVYDYKMTWNYHKEDGYPTDV